jgi:hypothetical protein
VQGAVRVQSERGRGGRGRRHARVLWRVQDVPVRAHRVAWHVLGVSGRACSGQCGALLCSGLVLACVIECGNAC